MNDLHLCLKVKVSSCHICLWISRNYKKPSRR